MWSESVRPPELARNRRNWLFGPFSSFSGFSQFFKQETQSFCMARVPPPLFRKNHARRTFRCPNQLSISRSTAVAPLQSAQKFPMGFPMLNSEKSGPVGEVRNDTLLLNSQCPPGVYMKPHTPCYKSVKVSWRSDRNGRGMFFNHFWRVPRKGSFSQFWGHETQSLWMARVPPPLFRKNHPRRTFRCLNQVSMSRSTAVAPPGSAQKFRKGSFSQFWGHETQSLWMARVPPPLFRENRPRRTFRCLNQVSVSRSTAVAPLGVHWDMGG